MRQERAELVPECQQLIENCKTLIMATSGEHGEPDASTTPFVIHDQRFYVFVSQLARHTGHLLRSGRCVLLFLQDESETVNFYARRRLTLDCEARDVERESAVAQEILESMAKRFGPVIGMLQQLPDFHLIQLKPVHCNYVRGFGQAFQFAPTDHPEIWRLP